MSSPHKLLRLAHELIDNKPLLIEEGYLRSVVNYLENRTESLTAVEASLLTDESDRMQKVITDSIAVIPIEGNLTYASNFMNQLCGMTSYQQLLVDVEEAISFGVNTVVFSVNSGGGEGFAMLSTANSIKTRLKDAGVKSIAYVDGTSASAAYGLSVIADEVIAHPDSRVGSVGVVIRLTDTSARLKNDGVKPIYITSAKAKVPFDSEGKFKDGFLEELQESVDKLHARFSQHVATNRNLTVEAINATEARVFDSDKALSLGLIDKIMNHDEFAEYLEQIDVKPQVNYNMNINSLFKTKAASTSESAKLEDDEAMKLAELQAQYDELSASLATTAEQVTLLQNEVTTAKLAIEEKDALLLAAQTELEEMKAAKAKAIADEKMAKLSAVYGDAEAADLFEAMAALPDDKFEKIVNAKRLDNQNLSQSTMFKEVGVETEASAPVVLTQEQLLEQRIKQQNQ